MRTLVASLLTLAAAPALAAPAAPEAAAAHGGAAVTAPAAAQAGALIRGPKGWRVDLWAAEELLRNPVAFAFDERGRAFIAETFRHHAGTLDARGRTGWPSQKFREGATPERLANIGNELLDLELAAKTLEDRKRLVDTYLDPASMTRRGEQIELVEDSNGDGKADRSRVFADGFNDPLDGLAASVLARKGDVFFTNIPSLWLLRDINGDGKAEVRKELHRGYGVRFAFIGHDLHGLRIGPDGRLYFSIGDRGAHVKQGDRTIALEDSGAVFRCELDGSNLELFATGLRNPQDLTFDDRGNLFTGDNNSDGGDRARWVYVVEGGDSGWRYGYQWLERPTQRGPWNAEKMWHEPHAEQPAHLVPPIKNFADGPSGIAFHPGAGAAKALAGRFFVSDFRGQSATSGVHSFRLEPEGAGWKLVDPQQTIWGVLATDVDFAPDGAIYVLDWIEGWAKPGKGRIWRISDPASAKDPQVAATRKLIGEGMGRRAEAELGALLGHPDQRVRQEAQFELAARGAVAPLVEAARRGKGLARLHGVWGLGQIARTKKPAAPVVGQTLLALVEDADAEVRGQAVKIAGETRLPGAAPALRQRMTDEAPRVRFFAATALAKVGGAEDVPLYFDMLAKNGDKDPYLRHAAVFGLATIGKEPLITTAATHESRSVRLGALLALRRMKRLEVGHFLRDKDPLIVREAARAVNDAHIDDATLPLAAVTPQGADAPTALRVVNANLRLGTTDAARKLLVLARDAKLAPPLRAEALGALGDWRRPSSRDRVTGAWHPIAEGGRQGDAAAQVLLPALRGLAGSGPDPVRVAAIKAAVDLEILAAAPTLAQIAGGAAPVPVRVAALEGLATLKSPALARVLPRAVADKKPEVRIAALEVAIATDKEKAAPLLERAMARGTLREKQTALRGLRAMPAAEAERLLGRWLDDLLANKIAPELTLDLLDAAARRKSAALEPKLAAYDKRRPDDEMGRFRETLVGGDAEAGKRIFFNKAEVSCLRCHKLGGPGGEVGPDLKGIGARRSREYLLESIVAPSKTMPEGFQSVILTLHDGNIAGGIVKAESADTLTLISPEGVVQTVKKADVKAREQGGSGMPDGLAEILTKRELRDLVEFLATEK